MMILINQIVNSCIKNKLIKEEEYELYYYCFESLILKIVFDSIILILAIYFDWLISTIFYYVGFGCIRYTGGGYHAKTVWGCVILSIGIYLMNMSLLELFFKFGCYELLFIIIFTAVCLVWAFAPVDHPNRRFSNKEKNKFEKRSKLISGIGALVCFAIWGVLPSVSWALSIGGLTAAFSIVVAKHSKEVNVC